MAILTGAELQVAYRAHLAVRGGRPWAAPPLELVDMLVAGAGPESVRVVTLCRVMSSAQTIAEFELLRAIHAAVASHR